MHARCTDPDNVSYDRYGGRGIRVCERWNLLENFDADMGYPPSPEHSLERKNVDGDYEPHNCCWATRQEQARNRCNNVLHEHEGQKHFLRDLAKAKKVSYRTLDDRIRRQGMTLEEALEKPTMRPTHAPVEVNGVMMSKTEAARKAGISTMLLYQRIRQGMTIEEALSKPVVRGRARKT